MSIIRSLASLLPAVAPADDKMIALDMPSSASVELTSSRTKWFHMTDKLSSTLAALADPTRRAILARLALGDASVSDLAAPFDMSVRAVSKHIGVLEKAGLVSRGREAQRRPSRLQLAPLQQLSVWLDAYRRLWEGRFDRIEDVIEQIKKGELNVPRT
jgi:DNA-binding transcriptional ArsR family regulator